MVHGVPVFATGQQETTMYVGSDDRCKGLAQWDFGLRVLTRESEW